MLMKSKNTRSEFSSRVSGSRPDKVLNREPSISSDRRYHEQFEDSKNVPVKNSGRFTSNSPGFSPSVNNRRSSPSTHLPSDSRTPPQVYSKSSHQHTGKNTNFQPPLPPMPPPLSVLPSLSQPAEHNPSQSSSFINSPPGYHAHSDSKYNRTSTSSPATSRPPPLPPTPPPYSAAYSQTSNPSSEMLQNPFNDPRMGNPLLTSYPPIPLMPPMLLSRPVVSMPGSHYASSPTPHQGESPLQNYSIPQFQPSMQSLQSSISHLQPLQPPQILRPPQQAPTSQQHHRPSPPQIATEPGLTLLQSPPIQMQLHQPVQVVQQQQQQVSPLHVYYQQSPHQGDDGTSQQQPDPGLSLQHYFSSPEAIQSLLNDREQLCQLLEQHPKLMQMLQETLGQR